MSNKVIIANYLGLKTKYQQQNVKPILDAIHRLIEADRSRGIVSRVVDISNAAQMRTYKGRAVTSQKSERQAKDAVDCIYAASRADYLVLLDSWDVIPHLTLANHIRHDDRTVPSDLPYASDAPFTSRDPRRYAAATRVVGRIAGLTGAREPSFLIGQIVTAAKYKSRRRADYLAHLGLSAWQWRQSTAESVKAIFDRRDVVTCPEARSPTIQKRLRPLTHFINCHGQPGDPQFYGERGRGYPVAITSGDVAKAAKRNTIVAAECCYGAQLFDPGERGQWPIANTYLGAGAIAFLGSSNYAWGPPGAGNEYADLLTQYFLIDVLRGASTGRAFLQARQKFVLGQRMEDPANLKTLAQFILLGDPSLHPCRAEGAGARVIAEGGDESAARATRRIFLRAAGQNAADSSGFTGKKLVRPPAGLHKQVTRIARQRGFRARPEEIDFFNVVGGKDYGRELRARGVQQRVITLAELDRRRPPPRSEYKGPRIRVLVAHAQNDRLIDVVEYVNR